MKRILLMMTVALFVTSSNAQLLTWTPPFPTDATTNFVITVDASKGNGALLNYTPTSNVYLHTGVITSSSTSSTNWRYVREFGVASNAVFTTPIPQLQATYLGNNKWQYTIPGSIRDFYGVPAGEQILKVALLFRNGNGTVVQRNSDGSDMFIPLYTTALATRLDLPAREPRFIPVPESQSWSVGTNFSISGSANKSSTLKLYHNNTLVGTAANATTISGSSTVTAAGNQQLVIEANDGSTTKYDTININVAGASNVAALPAGVRDGINYEADNTAATLVLHAPGKTNVFVLGDFNNWTTTSAYQMNKTPDGSRYWIRLTGLTPGTEYAFQYKVDNDIKIADPYAQKILDPWNDQYIPAATYPGLKPYPAGQSGIVSILQTAEPTYNWSVPSFNRPDKRGLVIYELLLRDFLQAHDWKTLKDTLSYLKNLGVNTIELLPFNEFEGNLSWGYNPDFYFAPDKYYGPKNTLKQFIDYAHQNGIAVVMDIALNHSFGLSPMVQLYWDAANNRPAANNPWYNPVAKHPFNVGFDFNHESLDTRYFTSRVVEHWVQEYKLDGFRFDLSKGFTQNFNTDVNAWSAYDASRIAIWKRYYDTLQLKGPGTYAILEHFAADAEEVELSNYGMLLWNNMSHAYQEASMGYVATSNLDRSIHTTHGFTKNHLVTYAESHDEERLMYKNINFGNSSNPAHNIKDVTIGLKRLELDGAFLFTIPGPKMLWQFGELGYDYAINYCENGTINNNCRVDPKPIRWDYKLDARRKNVYDVYSKLIQLRFHSWYKEAFLTGTIERSLTGAFKWLKVSSGDTSHLVVVGNFDVNATSGTVTFPTAGTWYDYLGNATFTATGTSQTINLQPGDYRVYVNRNVNNLAVTPVINVPVNGTVLQSKLYPNPAYSGVTLETYLPESSFTKIELLNAFGQVVTSLKQGFLARGKHVLQFDQIAAPAGLYYLRIVTKSHSDILKLTIQ